MTSLGSSAAAELADAELLADELAELDEALLADALDALAELEDEPPHPARAKTPTASITAAAMMSTFFVTPVLFM